MDNGDFGDERAKGLYCREVVACDHVGINMLVLAGTRNFFLNQPGYIVFEENLCKVVCPACLLTATKSLLPSNVN